MVLLWCLPWRFHGFIEGSRPSDCVRVCYPHDLELHRIAVNGVLAEIVAGPGGLCGGSHLLASDGERDGVLLLPGNLNEGVNGRLVPIHP